LHLIKELLASTFEITSELENRQFWFLAPKNTKIKEPLGPVISKTGESFAFFHEITGK
jgi:hypothetical protein